MRLMVRQRFGGEIYICHIPRLTPNLDLWLMMTMICENVDCGNCVRDCVSAEAEFEAVQQYTQK